jgi:uncharacterized membrane protein
MRKAMLLRSFDAEWGKNRLEALSDGVFAIAMTVLIFNFKLPEDLKRTATANEVWNALGNLIPEFVGYILSFVILGAMWLGHHNVFHALRRTDRATIWLNIMYLAWVSMMPFTTSVYSAHMRTTPGVFVYSANVFLAGVSIMILWYKVRAKPDMLVESLTPQQKHSIGTRIWVMPLIALAGMAGSVIQPEFGMTAMSLIPIAYAAVSRVQARRAAKLAPPDEAA